MIALLGSVLATSVLGSPHCAAMCGGFVCFYAGEGRRVGAPAHAAYHVARLLAYALLGAIAGSLGAGVERIGAWAGVNRAAAMVSGALLILAGAAALARAGGLRLPAGRAPRWTHAIAGRALRALREQPPLLRAAAIGALSGLLPCGWLYAYVAIAAGTGTPAAGAAVMAAFWLGTVPMLAGVSLAARGVLAPIARRLPVASGLFLVALGALTLAVKLGPGAGDAGAHAGHAAHPPAATAASPAAPPATSPEPGADHVHDPR